MKTKGVNKAKYLSTERVIGEENGGIVDNAKR